MYWECIFRLFSCISTLFVICLFHISHMVFYLVMYDFFILAIIWEINKDLSIVTIYIHENHRQPKGPTSGSVFINFFYRFLLWPPLKKPCFWLLRTVRFFSVLQSSGSFYKLILWAPASSKKARILALALQHWEIKNTTIY